MELPVHDHELIGYQVDGPEREIRLRTRHPHHSGRGAHLEVTFSGVIDHHFENAIMSSILGEIEEVDIAGFLTREKSALDQGHHQSGWPTFWRPTVAEMVAELKLSDALVFEIGSAYGISGWIAANQCSVHILNAKGDGEADRGSSTPPQPPVLDQG